MPGSPEDVLDPELDDAFSGPWPSPEPLRRMTRADLEGMVPSRQGGLRDALLGHLRERAPEFAGIDGRRFVWDSDPLPQPHPIGSWARCGMYTPARVPPRATSLYMQRLDEAIQGPDGSRLDGFLRTLLGHSRILPLRALADDDMPLARGTFAHCSLTSWLEPPMPCVRGGGDHRRAVCPFHSERTPSFTYSLTSRLWHCYGCGLSLTSASMTARLFRLRDREAVAMLARMHGVTSPPWPLTSARRDRGRLIQRWLEASSSVETSHAVQTPGTRSHGRDAVDPRGSPRCPDASAGRAGGLPDQP